ncbi:MAG: globin [Anaerolineaceae bacterium]|nr:globin [Anaerolineaceae bacterium]
MPEQEQTIYDVVGGEPTFEKLVDVFYERVAADEKLRPMFPEDLEPGKYWQFLFLIQLFGGPSRYAVERGHPRLRMRHAPFPIDVDSRDRWLGHMRAAIEAVGIAEPARSAMMTYFERSAAFMVNADSSVENVMQWQRKYDEA